MGQIAARFFVTMLLLLSFVPAFACANASPTSFPGAVATEPDGLVGVDVVHETLTIDLRPLAERAPAKVSASYRIGNQGEHRRVDLAFAGSGLAAFRVHLDGESVPTHLVAAEPRSESSARIPSIVGGTSTYEATLPSEYPAVALELSEGEHELLVEYEGVAALDLRCRPTVCWRFAHVLAPARAWSSFGGLDATILVPPRWEVLVDPTFVRDGDVLHASFADVPADAIGLYVRATVGPLHGAVTVGTWVLLAIATIGGAWACLHAGRWWCRGRRTSRALAAVLAVITWPLAILFLGLATVGWPRALVAESQAPIGNIGDLWALLVALAVCPIAIVLVIVGALRGRSRS